MQLKINRKLAIGASGLVLVLGGTGAAVAATQDSGTGSGRQAYLDSVAKHLGVTPSALSAAIRAADVERIEAAVAAGRLSSAQAQRLKERLAQNGGAPFFGPRLGRERHGAGLLKVAAEYLGVSTATLRSERAAGRSLAQIANSTPGKSAAGLKDALVKAITARLESARGSGRIGTQREQRMLSLVERRVEALLARTGSRARGAGAPGAR